MLNAREECATMHSSMQQHGPQDPSLKMQVNSYSRDASSSNAGQGQEMIAIDENSPIAMRAGRRTEILKQKQLERQRLQEVQNICSQQRT